jgi:hypothetical protein
MRTLTAAALAALQRSPIPLAVLVEMDLAAPLRLNTASLTLGINGITYYGTQGLGKIEAVQDSPAEIKPLKFELSGVPSAMIAVALAEPVQGKEARIKLAIYDPDIYQLLDVRQRWAGLLDVMAIEDGPVTATLQVTAEHAGLDLIRPLTSLYSDAEQRRLVPGDPGLQYMADQVDMRVVWPAASWGRR